VARIAASLLMTFHKFEAAMKQAGKKIDIKIYDDAGHAFENPNNKEGYRADDTADAWKRTVSFLAEKP
jgi:carboxymethylenebutenolidase